MCLCVCVRAWSLQLCASPFVSWSSFSLLFVVSSLPLTWKKSAQVPGVVCYSPLERRMQGVPLYCSGWSLDVLLGSSLLTPGRFRACLGSRRESYHPGFGPRPEEFLTWLGPVPQGSPVASAPFPARGLHPSMPSRPARGITSGCEGAFPHPVLGLVWLYGEPTCCVCLAWWLFPGPARVPVCARAQEEGGSKASPRGLG